MSKTDKTLGDTIRAAMEKAIGEEKCGCMHCSGNTVYSQEFKMSSLTVALAVGTTTDGEDALELVLDVGNPEATVIRISGDAEVADFRNAMEELFA
jgi:hypothetical protein